MKPKPFASLNHFTVPLATVVLLDCGTLAGPRCVRTLPRKAPRGSTRKNTATRRKASRRDDLRLVESCETREGSREPTRARKLALRHYAVKREPLNWRA